MSYIVISVSIFRPHAIIANKIDLPESQEKLAVLRSKVNLPVIAVSGKENVNIDSLRAEVFRLYETYGRAAKGGR